MPLLCLFALAACTQTDTEPTPANLPVQFSVSTGSTTPHAQDADRITHATVYLADAQNSTFIKSLPAIVSEDGTEISANASLPAAYTGKEIQAYFIANARQLSDPLEMQPGTPIDLSRFTNLTALDPLHGETPRYAMSAKITFRAGDTHIPEIRFDRSFAKVYIVPSADMSAEQQRTIRLVSAQVISASAEGYLFQEGVVATRAVTRTIPIDQTLDRLNQAPLCYLYPDEEGAHLEVTLRNEINGRVMSRNVIFRPRKNTAHKLTIVVMPDANSDCSVTVTDWDADITLPDAEAAQSSEIHVDEGIDLINAPEVYYYYNLLNESEKALYRALFDATNNFRETPPVGGRLEITLPTPLQGIHTRADFVKVTEYLWSDMPVLFNSNRVAPYRTTVDNKVLTYRQGYSADRELYNMRVRLVIKAAREFLATLDPGQNELETVKNVHDKFLNEVGYGGMTSPLGGNIVGGLVDKKVVCAGYAQTFQYLLQRCGIQALPANGKTISGGVPTGHAWNIVRVDGKYYFVDPTSNDGVVGASIKYDYFLKSKTTMDVTHTLEMTIPTPNCPEDYPLTFE